MAMKLRRLVRIAPLALLFAGTAIAQGTSSITGVVTDGSTGKPVVGAVVVVTSPALPAEQTAVTEAGGKFTVPNLPAGDYTLAVQFEGYKPFERSDLKLKEGTTLRANAAVVPEAVQMEEVVVTGSRIRRKDLTTPAPVTVLNRESVQASGKVSIGDFLQSLPEQGNAINTAVNNGGGGDTRVSLRSLGDQRTLVLVNGRRMVPGGTGADASVDLNTIPTSAIERIEVLKDGASAIYGSDAIGGVINIITRKNFNGAEVNYYTGVSSHGDGQINDVALTAGTTGDTGSAIFSIGFSDQKKAMAGDRSFSKTQQFFDATGENGTGTPGVYLAGSSRTPGGRISTAGVASGNAAFQGLVANASGDASGYLIHDSSLTASDPGVSACLAANSSLTLADCQWRNMSPNPAMAGAGGDLYNYAPLNYLLTPLQRYSFYSQGDKKLNDYARAFYEAMYVNRQSRQQLAPEPLIIGAGGVTDAGGNLVTISKDNYYNPFGVDFSNASMRLTAFGDRVHVEEIQSYRVVAGLDGTLPDALGPFAGWSWDASLNFGRTYGTYTISGSLESSRIAQALGPSMVIGGKPVCVGRAGDPTSVISGCVPLDLFHGSSAITQDQVDFLSFVGPSTGFNQLRAYQANVGGDLFQLLSDRKVALALGVEHRDLSGASTQDPLTAKFDSSNGGGANTAGSYSVNEYYGELSIPIVSNMVGVQDLELQAALRGFHYSNFGSDSTYKLGLRWSPVKDFTVRGTYSTAFRAPDISDLYAGQLDNFPNVSDPCAHPTDQHVVDRCGSAANNGDDSTQLRSINGGNPNLKPEKADIYTAGLVYQPTYLPGFSATLDYYNIAIRQAIGTIGAATILNGCYLGSNDAYCALISRTADGKVNYISDLNQNVGKESVAGVDLALQYDMQTEVAGRYHWVFDGTWLQKHDQTLADGTVVHGRNTFDLQTSSGQGGTNPEWKFNIGLIWGMGNMGAGWTTKFIGPFKECGDPNGDFSGSGQCYVDSTFQRQVKAWAQHDIFFSYNLTTIAGKTSLTVGVNNLWDNNPPKIYNTFASATDQYTYDQVGRYYYLRLGHAL